MQEPLQSKRLLHYVGTACSLFLFGAAIWILKRELANYSLAQIREALQSVTLAQVAASALLTALCYWILTGYDALAFKYVRYPISYGRVTFAAFLAFAFSNTIGMANFAGAAVRYRIYTTWGIRPGIIGEVVALDVFSNWLGFLLTTGTVFVLFPPKIPSAADFLFDTARPLGWICLGLITFYFALTHLRSTPIRFGNFKLPVPRNRIFIFQILIACLDFGLGGVVLYALLPQVQELNYLTFLGVYLLANTAGIISHVPGGLGVFETVLLLSMRELSPEMSGSAIFSALLLYRLIYFFLPFLVALALFANFEVRNRKRSDRGLSAVRNPT